MPGRPMFGRRDFLKHSMAVAAIAPTSVIAAEYPASNKPVDRVVDQVGRNIRFVIVDETLEDSIAFADELIARGAQAFSVQHDIGRLWFGELGRAFTNRTSIAGLTAHSELLVCASFARQHGAHIRYEGEHDCRGADVLTHSLCDGDVMQPLGAALTEANTNWPRALALHLANASTHSASFTVSFTGSFTESFREEQHRTTTHKTTIQTTTLRSATHPGSLFSWVIA